MRGVTIVFALILAVIIVYCGYVVVNAVGRTSTRRSRVGATWQVRHYAERGDTVVAVALTTPRGDVVDEHVVQRIPDADPDWQQRFLLAKQEAEERAFHLNSPS
jgi:pyridoxamine 5'-phosphate oxidase family protein